MVRSAEWGSEREVSVVKYPVEVETVLKGRYTDPKLEVTVVLLQTDAEPPFASDSMWFLVRAGDHWRPVSDLSRSWRRVGCAERRMPNLALESGCLVARQAPIAEVEFSELMELAIESAGRASTHRTVSSLYAREDLHWRSAACRYLSSSYGLCRSCGSDRVDRAVAGYPPVLEPPPTAAAVSAQDTRWIDRLAHGQVDRETAAILVCHPDSRVRELAKPLDGSISIPCTPCGQ